MLFRALNPWALSLSDIDQAENQGSKYYHTGSYATAQYERVERACNAIRRKQFEQALDAIADGQQNDTKNPLFDYLRAATLYRSGKINPAIDALKKGNAKGVLRLYATEKRPPDFWQWPELNITYQLCKNIATDPTSTAPALSAAIMAGNKIIWCEPSDPVRILLGISARQFPAKRLAELARERNDYRLTRQCEYVIEEGQSFRWIIRRQMHRKDSLDRESRAWILGRSLHGDDVRFRRAAALVYLDKQAEWTAKVRARYMHPIKVTLRQ
ncbi:hypothetical protein LLG39_16815 [bacterium]|nr:hypothetical protein [bacterium]